MGATRSDDSGREPASSDPARSVVAVLIAVKDLATAKSRLSAEFSGPERTRLVLAMLSDTVSAAGAVSVVDSVTVVTPDPLVADTARRIGARVLDEPIGDPALPPDARLNNAFASAAAVVDPGTTTESTSSRCKPIYRPCVPPNSLRHMPMPTGAVDHWWSIITAPEPQR